MHYPFTSPPPPNLPTRVDDAKTFSMSHTSLLVLLEPLGTQAHMTRQLNHRVHIGVEWGKCICPLSWSQSSGVYTISLNGMSLGYNEFDFFLENKEYRPIDGCKIDI
jgi:hypothetical protein